MDHNYEEGEGEEGERRGGMGMGGGEDRDGEKVRGRGVGLVLTSRFYVCVITLIYQLLYYNNVFPPINAGSEFMPGLY